MDKLTMDILAIVINCDTFSSTSPEMFAKFAPELKGKILKSYLYTAEKIS